MHLDISVDCPVHDSAHVRKLSNLFDVPPQDRASEQFTAEVPGLDESWDIGVIVGPSGSGKTTIARAAFGSNLYQPTPWPEQCAVVDCFGDQPIERITRVLTAVGFSSVPSWVKPYSVLSNGEKFRCELARALLSGTSPVVFDEYSSVVDRTMAKIASAATSKAIRTQTAIGIAERFVAVTCHHDVVEWLEPDWVLDMGSQSRLCLKTLDAHDGSERLWPLGAAAKSGSVDPLSRGNDADEAILSRLRWAGFDPPASLSPLDGSTEPDFGGDASQSNRIRPIVNIQGFQTEPKLKVLFLCTGNSCRSQMAEGWVRKLKAGQIDAWSAGVEPHGMNARAVKVMAEAGVDISGHHSKHVNELAGIPFDYVITVCDQANEACPIFPGKTKQIHVGFDDPPRLARDAKTEEEALGHYRRVRDEIRGFVERIDRYIPL
jgi:arsenate reductase